MKLFFSIPCLVVLMLSLANCSNPSFSTQNEMLDAASLDESGVNNSAGLVSINVDEPTDIDDVIVLDPAQDEDEGKGKDNDDKSNNGKGPKDKEDVVDNDEEDPEDSNYNEEEVADEPYFVCILEGPGKSVRLGLIDGLLKDQLSTPDTVCMTKQACTDIVSQKFTVKSAEFRGYCKNGTPQVIPMSNSEIQALISK